VNSTWHTSDELMTRSLLLKTLYTKTGSVTHRQQINPRWRYRKFSKSFRDPMLQRLADLTFWQCRPCPARPGKPVASDPVLVPQAIVLLAWDDIAQEVLKVLRVSANQFVGQMVDWLLSDKSDFAIRRRIPRILATPTTAGLLRG